MSKLDLIDCSLQYESLGSGDPLLLLPGVLGTARGDFAEQIAFFKKTHTVIAPDPRGYGQSRPPDRDFPPDFYQRDAEDFLALMSALGHREFAVLGWSDGANAAALMTARSPHRITQLVMWGGNSYLTAQELATFQSMRAISSWSPRAATAMREVYGDSLERIWGAYVTGLEGIYANGGDIYRNQLSFVRCPTLVLHGDDDPLVPAEHPQALVRGIPGCRFYSFPKGRHNIHSKYAHEFNDVVAQFLGETRTPSSKTGR